MGKSEHSDSEASLSPVSRKIRAFFTHSVAETVAAANGHPVVLVTGGMGIGKSTSFIPMLREQYTAAGRPVETLDNQSYPLTERLAEAIRGLPEVPENQRGVLLLDEVSALIELGGQTGVRRVMETVSAKRYDLIAVMAHGVNEFNRRDEDTQVFQEGAGQSIPVIALPLVRPDKAFAKEYLLSATETRGRTIPSEVLDYIVNTIPLSLTFLNVIRDSSYYYQTIEAAKLDLSGYPERMMLLFTQAEYKRFKSKLFSSRNARRRPAE